MINCLKKLYLNSQFFHIQNHEHSVRNPVQHIGFLEQ